MGYKEQVFISTKWMKRTWQPILLLQTDLQGCEKWTSKDNIRYLWEYALDIVFHHFFVLWASDALTVTRKVWKTLFCNLYLKENVAKNGWQSVGSF